MPYLCPAQQAALRDPAPLEDCLAIEADLGQKLPLDVLFSFSRHFDGQVAINGCQIVGEFFLLPCAELPDVYRSQLSRGLPSHYVPVARDSAFQKLICIQCTAEMAEEYGHVVAWSPLYEAEIGTSWSDFLHPK